MGIVYHIKTGKSPTSDYKTYIKGGGSWIVNRHSGYYIGRVEVNDLFEVVYETKSKKKWYYGRSYGLLKIRGFILPESLGKKYKEVADTCSPESRHTIDNNRRKFGKDFNAPAHFKETGTPVKVKTDCQLFYNYFIGRSFYGGNFRSKTGPMEVKHNTYVSYRFTTLDGIAAVIKHPIHGWGFALASSIERPLQVFNDNG